MAFEDEHGIPDAVDLGYAEPPSETPILDSLIGAVKGVGKRTLQHIQHPIQSLGEDFTEMGRQAGRMEALTDKWAKGTISPDERKELIHETISGMSGMGFAGSVKNIGDADKVAKALEEAAAPTVEKATTPIVDSLTAAMKTSTGKPISGPGRLETIVSKGRPKPIAPPEAPPNVLDRLWYGNSQERDLTRGIIREESGQSALQQVRDRVELATDLNRWSMRPKTDSMAFWNAIEKGDEEIKKLPQADQITARTIEKANLERRLAIDKLGKADGEDYFKSFVENYWGHMWDRPDLAKDFWSRLIATRTAAEGSKNFLKERSFDSMAVGISKGFTPKTWNPVEMALMKMSEMDRFITGHNIKNAMMDSGLIIDQASSKIPNGWVRLNDQMFNGKGFWAPRDAAKDFNNFFSPGLQGNRGYDLFKNTSNAITMAQLGLSGFHGLFEAVNSSISDLALAYKQITHGDIGQAAKSVAWAGSIIGSPTRDIIAGEKMMQNLIGPERYASYIKEANVFRRSLQEVMQPLAEAGKDVSSEAAWVGKSGGRAGIDPVYLAKTINNFKEAIRDGRFDKAVGKSIPAAFEMAAKPLMQWYVPRIKLGAFQKNAAYVMQLAKRGNWSEEMTRKEMQKLWDSIDNRFGQLVYDNLFWNKAAKDLALVSVRAPGWNLGTIRELGGGVLDWTKQAHRAIAEGKFQMTDRMAYSLAMPVMTGYIGAAVHFLSTGQMPQMLRDYYYPHDGTKDMNGNPNRIAIPTYFKDVMSVANHPMRSFVAKLNPAITAAYGFAENKQWPNEEIWHPDDPLWMKGIDIAKYITSEMTPFSLKNYRQRAGGEALGGNSLGPLVQSLVGIMPAPREFIRTPAENMVSEFLPRHLQAGPLSHEEVKQRGNRRDLESEFRRGSIGVSDLLKATGKGLITQGQLVDMIRNKNLPTIVRDIRRLDPEEAFKVIQVANPKERALLIPEVNRLLVRQIRKDPTHAKPWLDRLLELQKAPGAGISTEPVEAQGDQY